MSAKVSYVVLCDKHNTFGRFSEDESHFSRQAQHFGYLHHRFAWQVQHFRRVLLRGFLRIALSGLGEVVTTCKSRGRQRILSVSFCVAGAVFLSRSVVCSNVILRGRRNISDTPHQTHSTLYTLHSTFYTLDSTLYTLHFTLHTTLYTPHSTLYTLHSTLYTLDLTLDSTL